MVLLVVIFPWPIKFVAEEISDLFVSSEMSGKDQHDWLVSLLNGIIWTLAGSIVPVLHLCGYKLC